MKKENKKILIVEDSPFVSKLLIREFAQENFDVFYAEDGEKGLKLAFSEHPDLILLDTVMPKMDGLTMLKKLRVDNWGRNVPVIIFADSNDPEAIAEALEYNTFDFMVKCEWGIGELVKKVKQKLGTWKFVLR